MIQLIILSLWCSMPFAYSMYNGPGYALTDSDYCPGNSKKLSDDCKMAIWCKGGRQAQIVRCNKKDKRLGSGTCISDKYPSSNPCSQNLKARKDKCRKAPKVHLPDSNFCHLYYDCSDPTESKICPYPKLFSEVSRRCEDFKRVKCGSRVELKAYCHYKLRLCISFCRPCEVDHPSCEGYPDGKNYHSFQKSPHYMICDKGRFVKQGYCKFSRYGHPSCLIECGSSENRYYATEDCRSYVWCYYGRKFDYRCPPGTVFDKKRRSCEHLYDTCKPCGTKSC